MTEAEFAEWEAYHYFEPFGAPADDDRWRQMYALYYSANAKAPQPNWLDRDPLETERKRLEAEAARSLDDKLEAFFLALGVEVEPGSEPEA